MICGCRLAAVMRQSELEFLHDAALLLILGSTCSAVCVMVFFLAGLMILGPERTRQTIWPGGYVMGAMLTAAGSGDLGGAAAGDGKDWRAAADSEVRLVLRCCAKMRLLQCLRFGLRLYHRSVTD